MDDLGIIDGFLATFSSYIDSGFGLLAPDVAYLTAFLVGIDIVLAGVFWAMGPETNILGTFVKKVLYVGFFAFVLNNFAFLSGIIFQSFAQLGLNASGSALTAADLLRPGFVAGIGFTAAHPLLGEIGELSGPVSFFANIAQIAVLFLACLITLFAFFFIAIQLFVTIIEFKLTTLAGFVLVPFALWNKTSFLAEKVLGNVVASGVKLMVLAVIVGIGSTLFGSVTSGITPGAVTLEEAATIILASLALFALGIFGPGIAAGLVSGAPQLGAGAVVGSAAGVGAGVLAGGAVAAGAARAGVAGATGAVKAGSSLTSGTHMAFAMGKAASGNTGLKGTASGLASVAQAGAGAVSQSAKSMLKPRPSGKSGARSAMEVTGGQFSGGSTASTAAANDLSPNAPPAWARTAQRKQRQREAGLAMTSTLRDGDRGGSGEGPKLKQDED
ncbi:MAG: P-type conjugative transfer protein TrbL [Pseudomonadota bacterium]